MEEIEYPVTYDEVLEQEKEHERFVQFCVEQGVDLDKPMSVDTYLKLRELYER